MLNKLFNCCFSTTTTTTTRNVVVKSQQQQHEEQSDDVTSSSSSTIRETPADFETAITATGFGRFNFCFLLLAIPSGWALLIESTAMAYVLPIAECDLDLTLHDKGRIIAVTYLGMLSSGMVWGFLSDRYGRRKLLIVGYLSTAVLSFLTALSQSIEMILFAKFMGGFIINGPISILTAALAEFHSSMHRAKVIIGMGIVFSMGNVMMPLMAWSILPIPITVHIYEGFTIHSWNIFLLLCGVPALISCIGHYFMPESPKFLMTAGRNVEALQVFQAIYAINTRDKCNAYPITELIVEEMNATFSSSNSSSKKISFCRSLGEQLKPLLHAPHLFSISLVCAMSCTMMLGLNTLRQWLPQLFTAMNDFQMRHHHQQQQRDGDVCEILDEMINGNLSTSQLIETTCSVNMDNDYVYINSIIVAFISIIGYCIIGLLINGLVKKYLYTCLGMIAVVASFALYYAPNSLTILALSSVLITLSSINNNVLLSIIVDLFPTTLRTMAVSLVMMCGRIGCILGNFYFPYLIHIDCVAPFLFISIGTLVSTLLALLLPKTDMSALK